MLDHCDRQALQQGNKEMQVPPYAGVMQDHCDQVISAIAINKHSSCQEHPEETFSLGHHSLFRTLLGASVGTEYWDLLSADKTARNPDQKQPLRRWLERLPNTAYADPEQVDHVTSAERQLCR